jgi:Tol biopolymer transport system component
LLPGWHESRNDEREGRWTWDGKYFIFLAIHHDAYGLWALPEKRAFAIWNNPAPFELTPGIGGVLAPALSRDGKRLFASFDAPDRGDLLRYEPKIGEFVSVQGIGQSAGHAVFSPDRKQIAYISFPKMDLWKMNVGGTGRQQLASRAALPQWSPDGRRIAFMGFDEAPDSPTKIRVIPSDGGNPEQPIVGEWHGAPSWTADANGLVFGDNGKTNPIPAGCSLHRFDFRTGKTIDLANSTGLWSPRASPAGRFIAAETRDNGKLVLYDMRTSIWTELATFADSAIGDNPTWSKDGKYIYFDAPFSPDPAIYRIRVPGRRTERVASLKGIERVHAGMGWWIGLTPDNEPMVIRDVHSQEIFAWDLITR